MLSHFMAFHSRFGVRTTSSRHRHLFYVKRDFTLEGIYLRIYANWKPTLYLQKNLLSLHSKFWKTKQFLHPLTTVGRIVVKKDSNAIS